MSNYIVQTKTNDCGPVAVYNVLQYFNIEKSLETVMKDVYSEDGTSLNLIVEKITSYGLNTDYFLALNPLKLYRIVQQGTPVIVQRFRLFNKVPHLEVLIPDNYTNMILVVNPAEAELPTIVQISKIRYFLSRVFRQVVGIWITK